MRQYIRPAYVPWLSLGIIVLGHIHNDGVMSCLVINPTINKPMHRNVDVFTSCINRDIGSWAVTAVNEVMTGGASAGVTTAGALDWLPSMHLPESWFYACTDLRNCKPWALGSNMMMVFY